MMLGGCGWGGVGGGCVGRCVCVCMGGGGVVV